MSSLKFTLARYIPVGESFIKFYNIVSSCNTIFDDYELSFFNQLIKLNQCVCSYSSSCINQKIFTQRNRFLSGESWVRTRRRVDRSHEALCPTNANGQLVSSARSRRSDCHLFVYIKAKIT